MSMNAYRNLLPEQKAEIEAEIIKRNWDRALSGWHHAKADYAAIIFPVEDDICDYHTDVRFYMTIRLLLSPAPTAADMAAKVAAYIDEEIDRAPDDVQEQCRRAMQADCARFGLPGTAIPIGETGKDLGQYVGLPIP